MIGTSPPGPFKCGSTTCSVNAVATPASNALPPLSNVAIPTAVAIQWVEVTTPKVPTISGRVVNGLGLINFKALPPGVQNVGRDLKPGRTARLEFHHSHRLPTFVASLGCQWNKDFRQSFPLLPDAVSLRSAPAGASRRGFPPRGVRRLP